MSAISKQTYLYLQLLYNQVSGKCAEDQEKLSRSKNFVSRQLDNPDEFSNTVLIQEEGTLDQELALLAETIKVEDKPMLDALEKFYLVKNKILQIILMSKDNE